MGGVSTRYPALVCLLLTPVTCGCNRPFPVDATEIRNAEAAHDMDMLMTGLEEIATWHEQNRTGVDTLLARGVPPEHIIEVLEGVGLAATDELVALWSWRDGEAARAPFVWYHDFLSLEKAVAEYERLLRDPLVPWDERYVPIFIFEGEWYAAYCGEGATTAGPVVHVFVEDEPRVAYTNLSTLVSTMSEAFRTNAVTWDADAGAMVDDIRQIRVIHQRHNHGCPFPYYVPDGSP